MERILAALEESPYIVSLEHEKGGVGKTTISINLADAFQRKGFKVLLVDSDLSRTLSKWDEIKESPSFTVEETSSTALLKNLKNKKGFHLVIIDGAPGVNELTASIINASNLVLIPITPNPYDVWMTTSLIEFVKARQELTEGKLKSAFLFNRVIKNAHISRDIQNEVQNLMMPCLNSILNNYVIYPTSANKGETVFSDIKSQAVTEINQLTLEIIDKYILKHIERLYK